MDTHHRIVGILHIIEASFFIIGMLTITAFYSVITAYMSHAPQMLTIMAAIGTFIILPIFCLCIGQLIAAIALLRGNQSAKIWVMIFGGLSLFNFPIGTAIGIYTFWAFLREQPTSPAIPPSAS